MATEERVAFRDYLLCSKLYSALAFTLNEAIRKTCSLKHDQSTSMRKAAHEAFVVERSKVENRPGLYRFSMVRFDRSKPTHLMSHYQKNVKITEIPMDSSGVIDDIANLALNCHSRSIWVPCTGEATSGYRFELWDPENKESCLNAWVGGVLFTHFLDSIMGYKDGNITIDMPKRGKYLKDGIINLNLMAIYCDANSDYYELELRDVQIRIGEKKMEVVTRVRERTIESPTLDSKEETIQFDYLQIDGRG